MAAWNQLTQAQRDAYSTTFRLAREWAGAMARLNALGTAINGAIGGDVAAFLAALDAGDVPTYDAALGEQVLSKADFVNIIGHAQACASPADNVPGSYNSNWHKSLYVRAAGPLQTLQQGQG